MERERGGGGGKKERGGEAGKERGGGQNEGDELSHHRKGEGPRAVAFMSKKGRRTKNRSSGVRAKWDWPGAGGGG